MKKTKFIIAAIVALALIAATAAVGAASYEPGSSEDPIVTKSYVDSQIEALKKSGGSTVVFEPVSVAEGKEPHRGNRYRIDPQKRRSPCDC